MAIAEVQPPLGPAAARRPFLARINRLFALTVLVPTAIAILYFGLIASDVFISESRFVVRSPQRAANTGLGSLLQGAGFARSQDDSYTVHDYIQSRDALRELDQQFAVGKAYGSPKVDIFSRFAGLDWDDSFEALHMLLPQARRGRPGLALVHLDAAHERLHVRGCLPLQREAPRDEREAGEPAERARPSRPDPLRRR